MELNQTQIAEDHCLNNLWNLSDVSTINDASYSAIEDLFFKIFLPFIEIIGVLGNLAFILMVMRVPHMRTITNRYLLNIAVADLLFIGYACTFYIVAYFNSPIRNDAPFDSWVGCIVSWLPIYLTYFASILLISFATFEKYYGICRPLQHRLVRGKTRTMRIITMSWFLSAVTSSLVVLRYAKLQIFCVMYPDEGIFVDYPKRIGFCVSIHPKVLVFSETMTIVPFFFALIGNVYMYGRIIHTLSHRQNRTDTAMKNRIIIMQKQIRNQVARLLIINGVIFFCCQLPYRMLSINLFVQEATGHGFLSTSQYGVLAVTARCLVLINSCANPFVYFVCNSGYRNGFRQMFS